MDHVTALDEIPEPNLVSGHREHQVSKGAARDSRVSSESLRQLAYICEIAHTRQEYAQTDEEMVVCYLHRWTGVLVDMLPVCT